DIAFLGGSNGGPTYSAQPATSREPLLAYDDHPVQNEEWHALVMQQAEYMAPSAYGGASYFGYPDTQDLFPSQSWPAVEASDYVVPLFSPWHLPGIESGHNQTNNTDKGAAQAAQHRCGCTLIELCAPNTHVHFNYSQPTTAIPNEWSSHNRVTGEEFYNSSWDQPENDWSIPSTQYYQPDISGDLHPQQTMSDFEFMTTAYPDFGEAIQYSEAAFSQELFFQQASESGFEHMAVAYPGFGEVGQDLVEPEFSRELLFQEASSEGFKPMAAVYPDLGEAGQDSEAAFSGELICQEASSGFEPMAAAYWDFEVSSMSHNEVEWNVPMHTTDLYSWAVETTDINARLACAINGGVA
ncbi:hypothetical protein C2E23DRAFT_824960, partial [Lenzites betulinus]